MRVKSNDLWSLVKGRPQIDPDDLAAALAEQADQDPLDYRTRLLIHDSVEIPKGTPGYKPEGPEKLGLFLQNHGNPVAFRNIWAIDK